MTTPEKDTGHVRIPEKSGTEGSRRLAGCAAGRTMPESGGKATRRGGKKKTCHVNRVYAIRRYALDMRCGQAPLQAGTLRVSINETSLEEA